MGLQGRKQIVLAAAVVLLSTLLMSCRGNTDYPSSADCVLENIGSAQVAHAVQAIRQACEEKFPPSQAEIEVAKARHSAREQALREAESAANAAAAAAASAAGAANP